MAGAVAGREVAPTQNQLTDDLVKGLHQVHEQEEDGRLPLARELHSSEDDVGGEVGASARDGAELSEGRCSLTGGSRASFTMLANSLPAWSASQMPRLLSHTRTSPFCLRMWASRPPHHCVGHW